ncbi:replication initiator protein A [Alterisphingorhabdus coralli]|uniref:Replication initiator protein A n=1 Tax=Alterisphingorhabdus coralli TaxID=3071408 RepID=A0AA97F7F1_9SPHN|nr:replication initiator protein A [Parasphingorhabdus sp. SCSIO 66989]WOE75566.1 replication initiator protein A [Parasphingorhabdus sp. SCSIO 66989]
MSRAKRQSVNEQFDLFLPYIADLNFRDQREMMERPFFSLAKTRRTKPIDYTSPDGKLWVHVSANPDYGMATIWDADVLIYCASMLADMARRGTNDIPRKLHIMPYDLLRAIGRPTTGRAYELLGQALDRLVSTTIKTNIRAENRREATFSWLDGWTQLVDERTERSRGMTLELSNWFYEGVLMKGGVLAIDRAYFDITGGRERWLYKVAREHAGGAGEKGFAISMPTLFEKSGAEGQYRRFKFEILKLADKNAIPGYQLLVENRAGEGEPLIRMRRENSATAAADSTITMKGTTTTAESVKAKGANVSSRKHSEHAPQKQKHVSPGNCGQGRGAKQTTNDADSASFVDTRALLRNVGAGLRYDDTRGIITEDTRDLLRRECPGWDLYTLHAEFEAWVNADTSRVPANWQKAFIGWVKRHHARNRHSL